MLLKQFTLSSMGTNSYVLGSSDGHGCLVIDMGAEPAPLLEYLQQKNLSLEAVILTHGHYDHIAGVNDVLKTHPQAKVILGRDAQKVASNPLRNLSAFFFKPSSVRQADLLVAQPDKIELAGLALEVLDLPGHSPGSIGLYDPQAQSVYCGDTLFAGSVGRTDFPGASGELLLQSIRNNLMTLPDQTKVWPGHGPPSSIGIERRTNPFLNARG